MLFRSAGQAEHDRSEVGNVVSDLEPAIRVVVPGEKDSKVTVKLLSSTGKTVEYSANLKAKKVVQLPLAGIADGTYTVIITGQEPLVAGIRTIQGADSGTAAPAVTDPAAPVVPAGSETGGDFTWLSSTSFLTDQILIPVPVGPAPTVTFYNPANRTAEVTLSAQGKKDINLKVKAGEMVTTPLAADARYTAKGVQDLVGGLTFTGSGIGSFIPLNPANVLGSSITVYPR